MSNCMSVSLVSAFPPQGGVLTLNIVGVKAEVIAALFSVIPPLGEVGRGLEFTFSRRSSEARGKDVPLLDVPEDTGSVLRHSYLRLPLLDRCLLCGVAFSEASGSWFETQLQNVGG